MNQIYKSRSETTGAGAPETEIEITPAMMEAAWLYLESGGHEWPGSWLEAEVVFAGLYRSMRQVAVSVNVGP